MIDRKIGDKMISFEMTIGKQTQHLHLVIIDSRCTSCQWGKCDRKKKKSIAATWSACPQVTMATR